MDLAGLFLKTGVKNQRVALLLTDAQIPDERFLVIINDLLATGQTINNNHTVFQLCLPERTCLNVHHQLSNLFSLWKKSKKKSLMKSQYFSLQLVRLWLCLFPSRRNSWALQWGGDRRYCFECESWGSSPRPSGQQGELLEILHWKSSTTAHG